MTTVEPSYPGRLVGVRLGLLAAALFVVGTNAFVIAGVLPQIALGLGTTDARVGYTITLYAVVVAVGSPVLSILLAHRDRGRLMALALGVIAVGTATTAVASSLLVFELGRVLAAVGGAVLVPAATAPAPSLLPPEQRGRALAVAGLGFTLAIAVGSPAGTALAGSGSWRLPLGVLAGVGAALAVALLLVVRDVPRGPVAGVAARLRVLRSRAVVLTLGSALLLTASFNVVYIFSAAATAQATGGSSRLLAVLLLAFGAGGVLGTALAGRLTDRLGSRLMVAVALGAQVVALALVPLLQGSYPALALDFVVWGAVAFAAVIPVQHRLVSIDPATAGIALSWYSTAMYVGIALARLLGGAVLGGVGGLPGADLVPLVGAALGLATLALFLVGHTGRRPPLAAA
ncbi:MFS transporter [Microlunatus capsulatus]|uniref:MFS transporter n=1 Tax=Microlunatus capsulatus TaxID=99117 RepID=UPI0031D909F3